MSFSQSSKFKKFIVILMIIIISSSFCMSFYLSIKFYGLIGKSERDRMIELNPEYYELLYFAQDIMIPTSTVLFFDKNFYLFCEPLYYPFIYCDYYPYNSETNDSQILEYIKNQSIDYVIILKNEFPLSTNTTYFYKYELTLIKYLLEINKTAL